jgi:hypothetical protein
MKYGEDYITPCTRQAIESLNNAATKFDANSFYTSTDTINTEIKTELNTTLYTECYANINYFQISSVDLPDKFELAI